MQFPTHWARRNFTATDARGYLVTRSALGWSFTDQADAERHAQQRVEWAVSKAVGNQFEQYEYGHVPPREPVLETISLNGETAALVTRNRYGCRVLNTDRVLFADVDLPLVERVEPGFFAKLRRMSGKREFVPSSDADTNARIVEWQRDRPETSMRVYRTFAGMRLLFTDRQYDPTDPLVFELLESLGADRLYMQLTRQQETFRARLSPKPWRCGVAPPLHPSQIDHPDWAERLEAWAKLYNPKASEYATCQLLHQLGKTAEDPLIQAIIAVHDRDTLRANRPLA